jgi:hypothetical protein
MFLSLPIHGAGVPPMPSPDATQAAGELTISSQTWIHEVGPPLLLSPATRDRSPSISDVSVLMNQLGTPRGGCEEHSSKFSLNCEIKV